MKKHSVLIDLKVALNNGYCGIATENRLLYKMLSESAGVATNGLLISANIGSVFTKYQRAAAPEILLQQGNQFLHQAIGHDLTFKQKIAAKLKLDAFYAVSKQKFSVHPLNAIYHDTIWRNVFDKTLKASDKPLLANSQFYFTDLTNQHLRAATYLKKNKQLNTAGFDFAIFLEPQPVRVSPGTRKIVRYHDSIPISDPDFATTMFSYGKMNTLNLAAKDSFFVCNSQPTLDTLLQLQPSLEKQSCVIPNAISIDYKKVVDIAVLKQILLTRLCPAILSEHRATHVREMIANANEFNYIFHLSAFDPKKNQLNLIRAWEKAHYQSGGKLKLIIGANPGIFSETTEMLMRQHLERGNIIHLSHLATAEMSYLFSHAKAFLFPSYIEGFGLPPIEAMQCECPVIVSDIPAHRWVLGDAAIYCNPYDIDSMALRMTEVSMLNEHERDEYAKKGLACVSQYSTARIAMQWTALLDQLKNRQM